MGIGLDKARDNSIVNMCTYYYDEIDFMSYVGNMNRELLFKEIGIQVDIIRTGDLNLVSIINITLNP